jgi:hypothetical protein
MSKKLNRKGQAATEFIHTYGWVFLSFIVLTGALAYYNMGSIKRLVPADCHFYAGIRCLDVQVQEDLLVIALQNEFSFGITNMSISINGTCYSEATLSDGNPYGNPAVLMPYQNYNFVFQCQDLTGADVDEKITLEYISIETNTTHTKVGRLSYEPE